MNTIITGLIWTQIFLSSSAFAFPCKDTSSTKFNLEDFSLSLPEKTESLFAGRKDLEADQALDTCSSHWEYLTAMNWLEAAVVQAAISDPEVNLAMRELNLRLLDWMKETAHLRSEIRNTPYSEELETLLERYAKCDHSYPGCVGSDPKDILEAFEKGNLRENFFLSWNPAIEFIEEHLVCSENPNYLCICNVENQDHILGRIQEITQPKLQANLKQMLAFCEVLPSHKDPFARGRFGKANKFFRKERKRYLDPPSHAKYAVDLIPLSEREKKVKGSGPKNWSRGESILEPLEEHELDYQHKDFPDPDNLYYLTMKSFGFKRSIAISGSTDQTLNLGCILGMNSPAERQKIVLAAIGYMIPHGHHSIYEILVGGKSYGLHPPLNSEYYKEISPDPSFASKVESIYRNLTPLDLPTDVYYQCVERKLKTVVSPACYQGDSFQEEKTFSKENLKILQKVE